MGIVIVFGKSDREKYVGNSIFIFHWRERRTWRLERKHGGISVRMMLLTNKTKVPSS